MNINFYLGCLVTFLNVYVYILVFKKLNNIRKLKINFKNMLLIIIFTILTVINNFYCPSIFIVALISMILILLLFKLLFKLSWSKTLCAHSIIMLVAFVLDPLLTIFTSFIAKNTIELNQTIIVKVLLTITFTYSYYFIFRINKIIKMFKSLIKNMLNIKKLYFYVLALNIAINIFNALYSLNFLDYKYYVTIFIFIIIIFIYSISFFQEILSNNILNIKNDYLNKRVDNYKYLVENYKILKHNLKNDLYIIDSAPPNEKHEVIKNIYKKYDIEENWINNLNNIESTLQGLLLIKINIAENLNIKVYIDEKFNKFKINNNMQLYLDICDIIGICFDNAIEATKNIKEKIICLNYTEETDNQIIEILNTFNNNLDIDELGQINYSTKEVKSGLGLYYIDNLNSNIIIKRSISENIFKIKIIINKN